MTLDYETAKKLKAAGFPQGDELYCACAFASEKERKELDMDVVYDCETERVSKPSLEELIEECGEGFRQMEYMPERAGSEKKWLAVGNLDRDAYYDGSTPTEAVANLWLALNTKPEFDHGSEKRDY